MMRELHETSVPLEHQPDTVSKEADPDSNINDNNTSMLDVPDEGNSAKRRKREVVSKPATTKSSTKCKFFLEGRCHEGDKYAINALIT